MGVAGGWGGHQAEVTVGPLGLLTSERTVPNSEWSGFKGVERGQPALQGRGQAANVFRLGRPCGLCFRDSTLPLQGKSQHKVYVSEWAWPCSSAALFTRAGREPDLAHSWLTPGGDQFGSEFEEPLSPID